MKSQLSAKNLRTAIFIGLCVNLFLMVSKLSIGWLGSSNALIGDGLNSTTDLIISVMILLGLKISKKRPDQNHHYGHEKYEGVIYFTLGLIFLASAIVLIVSSIESIVGLIWLDRLKPSPSPLTVYVTTGALLIKVGLYVFMTWLARCSEHKMIKADARNHLIDIFATLVTLFGVLLARLNAVIFDDIAALVISGFIIHLSVIIIRESLGYLTDQAPEKYYVDEVQEFIEAIEGVEGIDDLKIRKHMTHWYVDVEIAVDHMLSLEYAHSVAETVHHTVETAFPDVIHCMVHVNPKKREKKSPSLE